MGKFDAWVVSFAQSVTKHRLKWIAFTLLWVMAVASGAQNLGFSTNYRVFFSEENPELVQFEELQNTYTRTDNILIVFKDKNGNAFSPETLEAVQYATEQGWRIPYSSRVDSVTNFQHTYDLDDDLMVEDLVEGSPSDFSKAELEAKKQVALNEPLLAKRLISPDGSTTGVNVTLQFQEKDPMEVLHAAGAAREIEAHINANYPNIETAISGVAMLNNAFMEASMNDIATLIPIMYILLLVALALFLRSIFGVVVSLFVVALSVMVGMGFGGLMGYPLTPPSAGAPTIILTLAIADSVHILSTMLNLMKRGMSKQEAIVEALRINFQPVFLTSITTAIGFLSLNFSEVPPFGHLGNMTAAGVIGAFFISVTFLPAFVSLLPFKVKEVPEEHSGVMDRFADFVIKFNKILLVGMIAIVAYLGSLIPQIELNDDFVEYFDKTVDFRNDSDFMVENLTGIFVAEYSLKAGDKEAVNKPEYLQNIQKFAAWLEAQPEVMHVYSMADVYKRLNKNMNGDSEAFYKLPEGKELAAQYLLLYEMSLPRGLDVTDRITVDKSATRLTATLQDITTVEMRDFKERSEKWLRGNMPEDMHSLATSPNMMFAYISGRNIESMTKGNIVALFLISLIIMIALRSVKMGLFSMIPNLVPAVMAFGVWSMTIGQVNMAVSVVMAMTLGIIVDDTVHFLSKYYRARHEKGLDAEASVRYAFHMVGSALVITSFTLVAGFLVLTTSSFEMNSTTGLLNSLAIVSALVADFLLLPPMLMMLDRKAPRSLRAENNPN